MSVDGWTESHWRSSWPQSAPRSLSPQQLDARLRDRFRLLAGGSRTVSPRHQTLRAAIEWSHQLLSSPEQVLLRRLSVFAGDFPLEAAEEVCAEGNLDVLLLVAALVDKSLLIHDPARGRCRMLETIRQFAWEKLLDAKEAEELRGRHRDWCLALAEAADLTTPASTTWRARLTAEQDNFRAALDWQGPEGDSGEKRLRLAGALWEMWWSGAQISEGRAWLERALQADSGAPAAARADALSAAAQLATEQGDTASALSWYEESRHLFEQAGDREGAADAVLGLSIVLDLLGRPQEAQVMREESVREARAAGNESLVALGTYWIAHGILLQGDPTSARAVYEEAREIWRSHGERQGMGLASILIGVCALSTGDQQEARSMVREGLQLTHEAGPGMGSSWGLMRPPRLPRGWGTGAWPPPSWAQPRPCASPELPWCRPPSKPASPRSLR